MKKYVLTLESSNKNNAGPKAKRDVAHFLNEEDYQELPLNIDFDPQDKSLRAKLRKIYDVKFTIPRALKKADPDVIIMQYPIYSTYLTTNIIEAIKQNTHAKIYILVHDVETIRLFKDDQGFKESELEIFSKADGLIVHNQKMHAWIKEQGIDAPIIELGLFDYYSPIELQTKREFDRSVVFAGNLAKADFLSKASELNFELTLFGPNPNENYPAQIKYAGIRSPEDLQKYLTQNFGLVWDGDSLLTCNGTFGEYMRYNNPHKVSLYLSSGMPVIIWKEAALADFIEENNVGFAVDSLNEVGERLAEMTAEEYQVMQTNALKLAEKLRQGYFVKTAVKNLEDLEGQYGNTRNSKK